MLVLLHVPLLWSRWCASITTMLDTVERHINLLNVLGVFLAVGSAVSIVDRCQLLP